MLTRLFGTDAASGVPPREGDLYKTVTLHGKTFEIRYGYYEEIDREHDPVPIYPDFMRAPVQTDDGAPFVTLMQDACGDYRPRGRGSDRDCGSCVYMERGDELIAVCRCQRQRERRNE